MLSSYKKTIANRIKELSASICYENLDLKSRKYIFNLTKAENSKDFTNFIESLEKIINKRAIKAIECDKKMENKKRELSLYDLENEKMKLLLDQVSYYNLEKEILMYKAYGYILNLVENKAKSMLKIMCYSIDTKNIKRERKKLRHELINTFLIKDY